MPSATSATRRPTSFWPAPATQDGKRGGGATEAILAGNLPPALAAGMATTIGVLATDATLTKAQARKLAQQSHDGFARAIDPSHTMWDGDTMFALATGKSGLPGNMMALGAMGRTRDRGRDHQRDPGRHRACRAAERHGDVMTFRRLLLALAVCAGTAQAQTPDPKPLGPPGLPASSFPAPSRPVAPIVSDRWRAEDERERVGEAARVIDWLGIKPGMTVADIGAGSGYYTVRLAAQVGPQGHVLAQDVVEKYVARLQERVTAAGLSNVSVGLGEPGDPRLPPHSADAVVMVHMYHEIQEPFALLSNLVPALRPGARVGIVDVDDAIERHGTPRAQLSCELAAAGYQEVAFHWLLVAPPRSEYLAVFVPPAAPPRQIKPCGS